MAKTNSTTPTVIPLDPALNEWVDGLVESTRHLFDSEDEAQRVCVGLQPAVLTCMCDEKRVIIGAG